MKEDDLVRLMDAYMGCEGFYMKPKIEEDGKNIFLLRKTWQSRLMWMQVLNL